ncbi:MAG: DUF1192 family protein [Hyphomonadaceae bacterium]|nr:DUF1192 family protein [Hyphomonadaceae bacterium]
MPDDDPLASPLIRPAVTLDLMSIDELTAKIQALKAEIEACERMIAAKQKQRAAADAMFGSKDG